MGFAIDWSTRPAYAKLILFGILMFLSTLIFSSLGVLFSNFMFGVNAMSSPDLFHGFSDDPNIISSLKLIQVMNAIGLFLVPAAAYAYIIGQKPGQFLKLNTPPKIVLMFLTIAIVLVSAPLIDWLLTVNQNMSLPESMRTIENWMRNSEETAAKITQMFLKMESPTDYILTLIIVAFLPSIGEEILFRGVIQKSIFDVSKNIHLAVIITGILFSAFHFQFFGFFPRMLLGILFGYLFFWSGTLWVPIFAHFINNGTAVTLAYLSQLKVIDMDMNETIDFPLSSIIGSSVLVAVLIYTFYKKSMKHQQEIGEDSLQST